MSLFQPPPQVPLTFSLIPNNSYNYTYLFCKPVRSQRSEAASVSFTTKHKALLCVGVTWACLFCANSWSIWCNVWCLINTHWMNEWMNHRVLGCYPGHSPHYMPASLPQILTKCMLVNKTALVTKRSLLPVFCIVLLVRKFFLIWSWNLAP